MISDAYTAGLVDGEGSFIICKPTAQEHRGQLVVEIREKEVVQLLYNTYGGTVTFKRRRKENHSDTWVWKATGKALDTTLGRITDHLIIKKEQAKVMIKFRQNISSRNGSTRKLTQEELLERDSFMETIRELNNQYRQLVEE